MKDISFLQTKSPTSQKKAEKQTLKNRESDSTNIVRLDYGCRTAKFLKYGHKQVVGGKKANKTYMVTYINVYCF